MGKWNSEHWVAFLLGVLVGFLVLYLAMGSFVGRGGYISDRHQRLQERDQRGGFNEMMPQNGFHIQLP